MFVKVEEWYSYINRSISNSGSVMTVTGFKPDAFCLAETIKLKGCARAVMKQNKFAGENNFSWSDIGFKFYKRWCGDRFIFNNSLIQRQIL